MKKVLILLSVVALSLQAQSGKEGMERPVVGSCGQKNPSPTRMISLKERMIAANHGVPLFVDTTQQSIDEQDELEKPAAQAGPADGVPSYQIYEVPSPDMP